MKAVTRNDQDSRAVRTVIVLQGERALWFKWRDGVLVDSFSETVRHDDRNIEARCTWTNEERDSSEQLVELVLDTTVDEFDKVKVERVVDGISLVQRWRLRHRLRRSFPEAVVRALPRYMAPDVMSIHHPLLPESWSDWLAGLQESGVYVSHVTTSLEILTRARHSIEGPVLYCIKSNNENRYLLVDQSAPLYLSTSRMDSEQMTPILVGETSSACKVACVGTCDEACELSYQRDSSDSDFRCIDGGELSTTLNYIDDSMLPASMSATVLMPTRVDAAECSASQSALMFAALNVNVPVKFTAWRRKQGSLVPLCEPTVSVSLPGSPGLVGKSLFKLTRFLPWVLPSVRSTSMNPEFRTPQFKPLASRVLKPSVANSLLRQRISALRNATVLCAAMATLTVVFATVRGIDSARQRAQLSEQENMLASNIVHLTDTVQAIHPSPEYVLRSIQRIQAYHAVKPMDTHLLLDTVASAITDFPALVLNSLTWSVIDVDALPDDQLAVHENMAARDHVWDIDAGRTQVQIELSGSVFSEQGLQDQQNSLRSFVTYLEAVPGISRVSVLESPAEAARSSEVLAESGARYRLSLLLSAS